MNNFGQTEREPKTMSKFTISKVVAREIIDCRGWPTVQADVWVEGALKGRADVPAGRSTGSHEAHELRDGDQGRYNGLGVLKAVKNANSVIPDALRGMDVREQRKIDMTMIALDGTPNKGRLGANAILGVSLAVARAAANTSGLPLYRYINATCHVIPAPLMNFINGGKLTANDLEIQEFIIIPVGAGSYGEALRITTEINEILRDLVIEKYCILATNTGDEGGFATPMRGIWEPLEFLSKAVEMAGYTENDDAVYAMDLAANSWYNKEKNVYELDGQTYDRDALIDLYKQVAAKYPIASMEDPLQDHRDYNLAPIVARPFRCSSNSISPKPGSHCVLFANQRNICRAHNRICWYHRNRVEKGDDILRSRRSRAWTNEPAFPVAGPGRALTRHPD